MNKLLENPILEVQSIYKSYTNNVPVLNDISFSVNRGEIIVITGENGVGKSTLLKIISGLDSKYEGRIQLNGIEYKNPSADIILLYQSYEQLFPWLTVENNIIFPLRICKKRNMKECNKLAQEVLELVGIDKSLHHRYPHQLSGGQKQKVAIARALSLDAEILLMDEPFSAIDEDSRRSLIDLINYLSRNQKKTVIMVSHTIQEVKDSADKIVVIKAST